ncbi:hypothetical protein VNO77_18979 [Canavalia gladiata]|uniref:Uncharacterized protein n=1 Tax=Canavalia gladiata TaxID=3824 RepID=A0AAN9QK42_CANGL
MGHTHDLVFTLRQIGPLYTPQRTAMLDYVKPANVPRTIRLPKFLLKGLSQVSQWSKRLLSALLSCNPQEQEQPLLVGSFEGEEEVQAMVMIPWRRSSWSESTSGIMKRMGGRVPPFSWKKQRLLIGLGFLMNVAFLGLGNLEGDL